MIKLVKRLLNNEQFMQVVKFGIVGVSNSVLDWCIVAVCVRFMHIDSMLSNIISYVITTPYNFWANGKFVFDFNNGKSKKEQFFTFFLLGIGGFIVNEITMLIGDKLLHFDPLIVKVVGIILAAIFNFFTRKLIMEKKKDKEASAK